MSSYFNIEPFIREYLYTLNDPVFNNFYFKKKSLHTPGTCNTAREENEFELEGIKFKNNELNDLTLTFPPKLGVLATYITLVGFFEVQCCDTYYQ